ncbi:hypothetical protein N9L01_00045 [bacterium]|nr:hypothetical protein [bacterium]
MPAIKQTTTSIELEATTVILDGNVETDGTIQIPAASSIDVAGAGSTSLYASAGANNITVGGATSTVLLPGNLTVSGTTTFIDTQNLRVEDLTIDLNSDSAGAGVGSNQNGGINILSNSGSNTVTLLVTGSDGGYLESSSGLSVASGKSFKVAGTDVLTATSLGSSVVSSSLTSVGTIATGVWNGTVIGAAFGGTGQNFSSSTGFIKVASGTFSAVAGIDLTTDVTGILPIANGGTGASSLTDGGILLGSGTAAITATAQPTDGQLLIGSTGVDPVLGTLTAGSGISISNAAGAVTITNTGGGFTATTAYAAGVSTNVSLTIPSGSSSTVGFTAQILMEDDTVPNTGLIEISGVILRSGGVPLLPSFDLIVIPGADADKVSLGTGGDNTLQFDIAAPSGTGDAYVNVTFVSD